MAQANSTSTAGRILIPGRNCWIADAPVDACGLLIDGRAYYRAFYEAARRARNYILIAGWKFSSDVRLLRGPDADSASGSVEFLPFLQSLAAENRELAIYILAWDYSIIYAWEWEADLASKFQDPDGRLRFLFDSQYPIGASHHQKFVVIDGSLAFVGGFDFNGDDWDDRDHLADKPDRQDSGRHHGPYHDVQAWLTGAAPEELSRYFQVRWHAAGGEPFELPAPVAQPAIECPHPIQATTAAWSVSQPRMNGDAAPVLQIRELYLDAIASARELIYIENQYFTADVIAEALMRRMRDRALPVLNIVIIEPKQLPGWVEAAAMEPARLRLLEVIAKVAEETGHELGVYYSALASQDGNEVATLIHSKVLIVDDRFLTVGSANVSNRSHGLDTELNVSWETLVPDDPLAASIRAVRADLLAEHCGMPGDEGTQRHMEPAYGLVKRLNEWSSSKKTRLRPLTREAILEDREWLLRLEQAGLSFDPSAPLVEDFF
jgi:phosphatidylserine/phosphatidylglycerophosphate/cardiolipin synthase-like enzyme